MILKHASDRITALETYQSKNYSLTETIASTRLATSLKKEVQWKHNSSSLTQLELKTTIAQRNSESSEKPGTTANDFQVLTEKPQCASLGLGGLKRAP